MATITPCQLAVTIAYRYFQIPFDGDPDTLAQIADDVIRACAEPADYCGLAGDCDQCLNPRHCICEHHCPDTCKAKRDKCEPPCVCLLCDLVCER